MCCQTGFETAATKWSFEEFMFISDYKAGKKLGLYNMWQ